MPREPKLQTIFEIISVGYELLDGRVVNTNASWLAGQISSLGGRVSRITVVGDDVGEISSAIREAMRRGADWIITSGGLGPTYDDMTLQGVAKAAGRRLALNKKALEMIRRRYEELAREGVVESAELTPPRMKMAMLPRGAKPLENEVGTAPGVLLRAGGSWIVCLPGVPSELQDIFLKKVKPILEKKVRKIASADRWIHVKGVPESALAPRIDELRTRAPGLYIKSHPDKREGTSFIRVYLRVIGRRRQACERILDEIEEKLIKAVKELGGEILKPEGEVG
ncbi:MAG: molybdopterin-binding protein [Nitrososphaerota archaeon]